MGNNAKLKILGIAVLLFSITGLYFLFIKNKPPGTNSAPPSAITAIPSNPPTPVSQELPGVISKFYENYQNCLKDPPKEASGKVSIYCQENTGSTSVNFNQNIEIGGVASAGADPIVCAQDLPENITVNPNIQMGEGSAIGSVEEKFGSSLINVWLSLVSENGDWKIDNVICPKQ